MKEILTNFSCLVLHWQVRREYGRQFDSGRDGVAKSVGHPYWIFSVDLRCWTSVPRRYDSTYNIIYLFNIDLVQQYTRKEKEKNTYTQTITIEPQ